MIPWVPRHISVAVIRLLLRIVVGSYGRYGLPEPDHQPFEHHPTINSELLFQIKLGNITPYGDIKV
jgi:hypothetical protein